MLIDEIVQEIRLVFRKQRKGNLKDSEIRTALTLACKERHGDLIKEFYKTNNLPSGLEPFRFSEDADFSSSTTFDLTTLTHDVAEVVALSQSSDPKRIGIIYSDDEWEDTIQSSLLDAEDTFVRKVASALESNNTLASTTISYIKLPTSWFVYAVTVDGDARGTSFDSGNSTDIEFKSTDAPRLTAKALVYLGLSLQDQAAIQVGAGKDN